MSQKGTLLKHVPTTYSQFQSNLAANQETLISRSINNQNSLKITVSIILGEKVTIVKIGMQIMSTFEHQRLWLCTEYSKKNQFYWRLREEGLSNRCNLIRGKTAWHVLRSVTLGWWMGGSDFIKIQKTILLSTLQWKNINLFTYLSFKLVITRSPESINCIWQLQCARVHIFSVYPSHTMERLSPLSST